MDLRPAAYSCDSIFKSFLQVRKTAFYTFLLRYRALILMTLFFHIAAAIFSVGAHHPDEHYQTFEFIGPKISSVDNRYLPWEFKERMRSWLFPGFIFLTQKVSGFDMLHLQCLWRFICSLSGLAALLYYIYRQKLTHRQNLISLTLMTFYFWFLPYVHARASGENLGATLLLLGLLFLENLKKGRPHFYRNSVLAELLIAAAVQLRFHIGIMIFSWFIWNWRQTKNHGPFILSALLTTLLCAFVDYWGYEQNWTFPPYNYFYQNIILDRSSTFGIMPWHGYFTLLFDKLTTPLGVFILFSLVTFWLVKPKHNLTALTLPFFFIHSLVPHKELRFLVPLIPFALLAATYVGDFLTEKMKDHFLGLRYIVLGGLALYFTAYTINTSFFAANKSFLFLKEWNNYPFSSLATPILTYGRENPFYPFGLTSYTLLKRGPPHTLNVSKYEDFAAYLKQHPQRLKEQGIFLYSSEYSFLKYVTYYHPECRVELSSRPFFNPSWHKTTSMLLKCKK